MVLKLYGWSRSSPCLVVALVLYEKEIPFEYIEVDVSKWEHRAPGYLDKHPFGQVPVVDDDGFVLYESRAIARYLEEKYPNQGTKLLPNDLRKRALVDQAAWAESFHFDRYARTVTFEILNRKFFGQDADLVKVAGFKQSLSEGLAIYEQILSRQKYIAGDVSEQEELTLADLFHIPLSIRLLEAGVDIANGRPNVGRWINELQARESWTKVKERVYSHTL